MLANFGCNLQPVNQIEIVLKKRTILKTVATRMLLPCTTRPTHPRLCTTGKHKNLCRKHWHWPLALIRICFALSLCISAKQTERMERKREREKALCAKIIDQKLNHSNVN